MMARKTGKDLGAEILSVWRRVVSVKFFKMCDLSYEI